MENIFRRLDNLAGIETENKFAQWLERVIFIFSTLMIVSAPHSIAATQTAWLIGMFFWAIRLCVKPRPKFVKTPLNIALWAFVGWTVITCIFSYAPDISIDRLRNVSVFLMFFLLVNNLRAKRTVIFLAFALILSCMVNVIWTPLERIAGRGVQVLGVKPESPLAKVGLVSGDALLKANDKKISSPEELAAEIESREATDVYFYRPDFYFTVTVHKSDLLNGSTALEKLGVENWRRSRNWRSQGFFAHWATYSEVLQLIASLTFGFLAALFLVGKNERELPGGQRTTKYKIIFAACLAGMLFALLLTTTRASQLGFIVSAIAVVWLTGRRKWLLTLAAIILPLSIIGFIYLQQARNVGVIDSGDGSTQYRMMMYRDGFRLWTTSPRNFLLGVGMDSLKRYWQDWHLFDNGWQPMGHFHSTIFQLLVERGLPALLLWLLVLWYYGRTLVRGQGSGVGGQGSGGKVQSSKFKVQGLGGGGQGSEFQVPGSGFQPDTEGRDQDFDSGTQASEVALQPAFDWKSAGILLGCFGGLVGFFTSGLVHYNLGDTQVASVFFILMGLSVCLSVKCER